MPDGTYTLTVRLTDAAGNVGRPLTATYALRTLGFGGPVRVDPPSAPGQPAPGQPGTGVVPQGPGRGGTGAGVPVFVGPRGSVTDPRLPIQPAGGTAVVPPTGRTGSSSVSPEQREVAAPKPEPEPSQTNPLFPRSLPADVPEVLRGVVSGTITRPTLPLALLAIVVLFLLAQNRIDRRDPKLASAPVDAEPELDFTAYVRQPGSVLS
jgi:hypothetical protein